ncbi:17407_t:CDS:2 [Dentiscutata heterogama]|uniref:17407_t:CDS:1 n=1 Tax=Dentiscutata heterogama TaxID=1316150 RepID=A0ACA9M8B2_9GLOM|nr:17407_t:CDS:2 [Dentiscutata heterogama]
MIALFSRKDLLEEHIKYNYHSQNNPNAGQREIFTEKDLEADSDPVENNIINEKTIKLQKQKPNSYGYALIQTDKKLAKEIPKLCNLEKIKMTEHDWRTYNSARKCYICEGPLHEARYNKATEEKLAEAIYHTEGLSIEEENIFKTASECCICKMKLQADINKNKIRDHDHFTEKYRSPAHRGCNLQLHIKPDEIKISLIYYSRKHYNFYHKIRELGLISEDKIEIIADN